MAATAMSPATWSTSTTALPKTTKRWRATAWMCAARSSLRATARVGAGSSRGWRRSMARSERSSIPIRAMTAIFRIRPIPMDRRAISGACNAARLPTSPSTQAIR
ncbi:peptidase [Xanthomonas citri pv. aurantifolii str. ICPB 10535]|nr:peptidase [Xanthomonas citri pv. aurantifolii str. ICPB 10535]